MVLAAGGAAVYWQWRSANELVVDADQIGDLCALVDMAPLAELAPVEVEPGAGNADRGAQPARFDCTVTHVAEEDATDYLTATVFVDMSVYDSASAADEAFSGMVDFETAEGRQVRELPELADDAGFVVVGEADGQQEFRVHLRLGNATVAVTLYATGTPIPDDQARDLLERLATKLTDGLTR